MPIAVASFVCGLIFGTGLLISGMTQPTIVLGFLDVFGVWNPTLAFVMGGALAISSVGYAMAQKRGAPLLAGHSLWPTRTDIDRPLVAGAVLFGAGWGLVGLCPGPALENLASLSPKVVVFVIAMGLGMIVRDLWQQRAPAVTAIEDSAPATSVDG